MHSKITFWPWQFTECLFYPFIHFPLLCPVQCWLNKLNKNQGTMISVPKAEWNFLRVVKHSSAGGADGRAQTPAPPLYNITQSFFNHTPLFIIHFHSSKNKWKCVGSRRVAARVSGSWMNTVRLLHTEPNVLTDTDLWHRKENTVFGLCLQIFTV